MATPNPGLIEAMRETADRIESPESDFDWFKTANCNCGQLARTLMQMKAEQLEAALEVIERDDRNSVVWEVVLETVEECQDTNIPLVKVVQTLHEAGLTSEDLLDLECLKDDSIRKAAEIKGPIQYKYRSQAALCMRTWADLLEEELGQLPVSPNP